VDRAQERTPRVLDLETQIPETVEENPSTIIRQLVPEFQVSQFVVCRVLKAQGLHRYHVQRVQALQPNDYIRWQEFCEWAIQKCLDQPDFLQIVLFADEASFTRIRDNLDRRAHAYIRNHDPHFE
jgi:hypothetical protein